MGLIFKRQLSGSKIGFNKRVADSQISNKYIREVAKEVGSKFVAGKSGARKRFQKQLIEAQQGGLDRKEVHEIIQSSISAGDLTAKKAKKMSIELGLTEKRFRTFGKQSRNGGETGGKAGQQAGERGTGKNKLPTGRLETLKNKKKDAVKEMPESPKTQKINSNAQVRPNVINPINDIQDESKTRDQRRPSSVWEILNKQQHPVQIDSKDQEEAV
jgi:hypothetical protein